MALRNSTTPQIERTLGKARIKSRLIVDLDPDEWDLPPKPKWMRWKTYNRHVEQFNHYEAELDRGFALWRQN